MARGGREEGEIAVHPVSLDPGSATGWTTTLSQRERESVIYYLPTTPGGKISSPSPSKTSEKGGGGREGDFLHSKVPSPLGLTPLISSLPLGYRKKQAR